MHAQILREHKQTSSITRVESASFHRLKLKHYKVLSSFAVKFDLRRYKKALVAAKKDKNTGADEPERAMVGWCTLNLVLKLESSWLHRLKLKHDELLSTLNCAPTRGFHSFPC